MYEEKLGNDKGFKLVKENEPASDGELSYLFSSPCRKSSNNKDLGTVSDVWTLLLVWRAGRKARLSFYDTRRSYGVLIADAFLGFEVGVVSVAHHRLDLLLFCSSEIYGY